MNLSALDLSKCIYLDIEALPESNQDEVPAPFFAGTYRPALPGSERYTVAFMADYWRYQPQVRHSTTIGDLKSVLEAAIQSAKEHESRIISWSDYESRACKTYAPELYEEFDSLNINLLPIAKKFLDGLPSDAVPNESIRFLTSYVGCEHPEYSVVENVQNQPCLDECMILNASQDWNSWSDAQKGKLRSVVEYNYTDCQELPNFLKLVAQGYHS